MVDLPAFCELSPFHRLQPPFVYEFVVTVGKRYPILAVIVAWFHKIVLNLGKEYQNSLKILIQTEI